MSCKKKSTEFFKKKTKKKAIPKPNHGAKAQCGAAKNF